MPATSTSSAEVVTPTDQHNVNRDDSPQNNPPVPTTTNQPYSAEHLQSQIWLVLAERFDLLGRILKDKFKALRKLNKEMAEVTRLLQRSRKYSKETKDTIWAHRSFVMEVQKHGLEAELPTTLIIPSVDRQNENLQMHISGGPDADPYYSDRVFTIDSIDENGQVWSGGLPHVFTINKDDLELFQEHVKGKQDAQSQTSSLSMIGLQDANNKANRALEMLSNTIEKFSKALNALIANITK